VIFYPVKGKRTFYPCSRRAGTFGLANGYGALGPVKVQGHLV